MKTEVTLKRLMYALVVLLSLAALLLVALSPADYLDAKVIYQAF